MDNNKALEILDHNWTRLVNSDYTDEELGQAQDLAIKALKRPRGEWLNHNSYFKRCSICNKVVGFDYIEQEGEIFKYCPNCGADMRGGSQ